MFYLKNVLYDAQFLLDAVNEAAEAIESLKAQKNPVPAGSLSFFKNISADCGITADTPLRLPILEEILEKGLETKSLETDTSRYAVYLSTGNRRTRAFIAFDGDGTAVLRLEDAEEPSGFSAFVDIHTAEVQTYAEFRLD